MSSTELYVPFHAKIPLGNSLPHRFLDVKMGERTLISLLYNVLS